MVGIISNTSAMQAQMNLERANAGTQSSIARLSSGQKIVKASDDVAGLAVGTIIQTNISTMKAALTNATQAQSLLSVADGALAGIATILQRQKALASQATSGSLDDASRGYLDQEFQNLKQEIDGISVATNFNDIKLIDGSLWNPTTLDFDTRNNATKAEGVLKIVTALADTETITISNIDAASSVVFTAVATSTSGDFPENLLQIDIGGAVSAADQATEILNKINQIKGLKYDNMPAAIAIAKEKLMKFDFTAVGAAPSDTFKITAKGAGTVHNSVKVTTNMANATDATLDGVDIGSVVKQLDNAGVVAVTGALAAGTFPSATNAYNGSATTIAQGSVSDGILRALTTTAVATTGVNAANISNNPDFIGTIQGFEAKWYENADNFVDLSVKVGAYNYVATGVRTNPTANTIVTFASDGSEGGTFSLQFAANQGTSVDSQATANTFASRLNGALKNVEFYQKREITNYTAGGSVYPTGSTTASGSLAGSQFRLIGKNFSNVKIEDVKVKAPVVGATQASIQFTINGEVYQSGYDFNGAVLALGSSIANNAGGGTDGKIGFVSQTNPNNILVIDYASATNLSITNTAEAEGAEIALKKAFGIGNGDGGEAGLKFQVGTTSTDNISVQVESVKARDIFVDSNNIFQDINLKNQTAAEEANPVIDSAIRKVAAVRAKVGAMQSRFNYAATNITSSIQNQDFARSVFLDTDFAAESTELAQAQVRLNASISVLAQANLLPQSLLKLLQ